MNRVLSITILPMALLGCAESPINFQDSIDLKIDFGFFQDEDGGLNDPYVRGAEFFFGITHRRDRDMTGWRVVSQDEDRFPLRCEGFDPERENINCIATAAAEGIVEVVVINDRDEPVGETTFEIALPDRVEMLPSGPLIIDRTDLIDGSFQVLEGGTSTWLARYYIGDTRLHGNGTLSVEGSESFDAWTANTFMLENRDWLQGSALSVGEHTVAVSVDGAYIADMTLTAVSTDRIDRVELHGMNEDGAMLEDDLVVLAQAYDDTSSPIYGVEYQWALDGDEELGEGDLYRYEYDPAYQYSLSASVDGLGNEVTIHGIGEVDSSNNVGCSSLGGTAGGLAGLLIGLLGLVRRRR
jgi:hypothetical protein